MQVTSPMKKWEGRKLCKICRKLIRVGDMRYRHSRITTTYYAHEDCRAKQEQPAQRTA